MSSQCEAIIMRLENGGTLTPLSAYELCGTLALHSRISELRERGYPIDCKLIRVGEKTVGEYRLALKVAYG